MFQGFESTQQTQGGASRLAAAGALSLGVYAAVAALVVVLGARVAPVAKAVAEKTVEVAFRPLPKPPPPPPAPPPPTRVVRRAPAASPAPAPAPEPVAPPPVPVAPDAVTLPSAPAVEGGVPGGTGTGPATSTGTSSAPIHLPESGTPPVADPGNAPPDYPEEARLAGRTGLVVLRVVVTANGTVGQVQVLKGEEPFVAAAVSAVKRWRYTPARVDGAARAVFQIVKVPFRLRR